MIAKVLLFCPLKPELGPGDIREPLIYERTMQGILAQDYPIYDIWLSKGDNPYFDNNGRWNIAHNYEKARQRALDQDYDYLFTVEADLIIPGDALTRLLDVDADIAYGLYCFRATGTWSAWTRLDMEGGRSLRKDPELARQAWGRVIDVAGVGRGCTLISRRVLEALTFHTDEAHPTVHNDWVLAYEAQQAGFSQRCDLGVVCGHIDGKGVPRIVWPDLDAPKLTREERIESETWLIHPQPC